MKFDFFWIVHTKINILSTKIGVIIIFHTYLRSIIMKYKLLMSHLLHLDS